MILSVSKIADKLTGISLCMGDYTHKSLTVDSVSLDLYFYRGENYFRAPFVSIKDSLPSLVKQTSELMATKWGHPYLYDRLSLLEAPVSFATYIRDGVKRAITCSRLWYSFPNEG